MNRISSSHKVTFSVDEVEQNTTACALKGRVDLGFELVEHSAQERNLLAIVGNPLLSAAAMAFAQHYPLVLCPDAIWLTIASGLAQHVDMNSEKLRPKLVEHSGKIILTANIGADDWEHAATQFSSQIERHLNPDAYQLIRCDFSTSGTTEIVASEMLLMGAVKSYFEFTFEVICGIPEITLLGSPDDWREISNRVDRLADYGLEKWTRSLKPILDEFINASEGTVNRDFWRGLYQEWEEPLSPNQLGRRCASPPTKGPTYVTGWIAKFFPYTEDGRENYMLDEHPHPDVELAEIDHYLQLYLKENPHIQELYELGIIDLELRTKGLTLSDFPLGMTQAPVDAGVMGRFIFSGGMIGVVQDEEDCSVRPVAGWAVGKPYSSESIILGRRSRVWS